MNFIINLFYYLMTAFFSVCFLVNFRKSKKWQEELLYLLALLPFLLRVFHLK